MTLDQVLAKSQEIKNFISEFAESTDREGNWPEKGLRALQTAGLGGLVVPKKWGGLGHGLLGLAQTCEILAQGCSSTAMCFGMHHVGTAVIAAKATSFQKDKFLDPIVAGQHLTTLALSEPGSGAHFYYPQTQLESISPDMLKVSGQKTFVTNGRFADSYVVSTVAVDPTAHPFQFSCVVLENANDKLVWGPEWKGIGMRGNSSTSLDIRGATIPATSLLGEKGDQLWFIFNVVTPYFLTAMAGTYLGIAQAAFEEAQNHLKTRTYSHSGTSLNEHPVIQHKLGILWAKIERTRRLVYHACQEGDKGNEASLPAIMAAKAEVANCANEAVAEAMTLMGGIGYRENGKLSRLLRDARAAHVMAPTTDILYTWIGRALLDQPILSD